MSVDGNVKLLCRSNQYFEFCVWRHKSEICEFEWKRAAGKVTNLTLRCVDFARVKAMDSVT